jgi:hypothetical protein
MIRIFFSSIDLAIAHAKAYGGRIAQCADGSIQWFAFEHWTMTPIMQTLAHERRGNAIIGPWSMFDPTHPSHETLTSR